MLLPTSHPHPLPSLPTSHLSPTTLTPHLPLFHQPHSPPSTHHLPPSLHTSHSSPPTLHPPPSLLQDEQPVKTLDLTTAVECCRDWTYSKDHGFRYVATFTHRYWHWCGRLMHVLVLTAYVHVLNRKLFLITPLLFTRMRQLVWMLFLPRQCTVHYFEMPTWVYGL